MTLSKTAFHNCKPTGFWSLFTIRQAFIIINKGFIWTVTGNTYMELDPKKLNHITSNLGVLYIVESVSVFMILRLWFYDAPFTFLIHITLSIYTYVIIFCWKIWKGEFKWIEHSSNNRFLRYSWITWNYKLKLYRNKKWTS